MALAFLSSVDYDMKNRAKDSSLHNVVKKSEQKPRSPCRVGGDPTLRRSVHSWDFAFFEGGGGRA